MIPFMGARFGGAFGRRIILRGRLFKQLTASCLHHTQVDVLWLYEAAPPSLVNDGPVAGNDRRWLRVDFSANIRGGIIQ